MTLLSSQLYDLIGQNVTALIALPIIFSLICTFTLSLALNYKYTNAGQIALHSRYDGSIEEFFESFFESFFLARTSFTGYRNRPSANLRILSTLWTTVIIAISTTIIFHILNALAPNFVIGKVDAPLSETYLTITFAFVGLWFGLFWKEKKDLHSKWEYLADIYNTLIQQKPSNGTHFTARESLRASLVVDALLMGMWAHKSFYPIFEAVLLEAWILEFEMPNSTDVKSELRKNLEKGGVSYSYATQIILSYQDHVIQESKKVSELDQSKTA